MLQIDRRSFQNFDWISFFLILALLSIGVLFVWSSTYSELRPYSLFFKKQCMGAIAGIVVYFIFSFMNFEQLCRRGYFMYFAMIALLVYTYLKGFLVLGARRWISLYFIRMQPSELTKFLLPFFIGYYISEEYAPPKSAPLQPKIQEFLFPFGVLVLTVLLILKQPDLGTALIVFFQGLILLWLGGMPRKFFYGLLLTCTLCAPIMLTMLKPYQKQRILVLLGHGERHKERYQIEQATIAIGSGGLAGKGLLKGTQNKLAFLPEDHSDFIFAVICEEWGLCGALTVLLLFLLLFIRLTIILRQTTTILGQLVAAGHLLHIALSVIINLGMVLGLLPIVGIPLPLLSYGLSYLLVTLASLGILNNVAITRP